MDDDGAALFGVVGAVILGLIGLACVVFAIWFIALRLNTAVQPEVRKNINNQAPTMIANNSYFHTLYGQVQTDKADIAQFDSEIRNFSATHNIKKMDCNSVESYGDCQTYQNELTARDDAIHALAGDVNQYNAAISNTDYQHGLDRSLPQHLNNSGN